MKRTFLESLRAAFKHEDAFRQEVLLAPLLITAALELPASGTGKALMMGGVLLGLIVELLNSALEAAVFLCLVEVPVMWVLVRLG